MSDKTWNQDVPERLQAMLPCDNGKRIKGEPVSYQVHYRAVPSLVSINEEFVKDLKARAGTFVLITNILDDKEFSPADVLREYKN